MLVIRRGQDPIELRAGDEPFQTAILLACALWGLVGFATLGTVSTSTTQTIPLWGRYLFFAGLAIGSISALVGVVVELWLKKFLGFSIERAGLIFLAGLCGCYSIWALTASGVRAVSVVFLLVAVGAASAKRSRRISRDLKKVASAGGGT